MKKYVPFKWTKTCNDAFKLMKKYLTESLILKYPNTYYLQIQVNMFGHVFSTQAYTHIFYHWENTILNPITYVSGFQLNWAVLMKEAYAIYIRKLSFYLDEPCIILRSYHLPLWRYFMKNTLNSKVNNWAVGIKQYWMKFEYIKDIKKTLSHNMSRLVEHYPDLCKNPECEGYKYGYCVFEQLPHVFTVQNVAK